MSLLARFQGVLLLVPVFIVRQLLTATLPHLPYEYDGNTQLRDAYDFIVVGAGAGGCTVAGRLSATGATVLLLEAGDNETPDTVVPGLFGLTMGTKRDWYFDTVPQKYSHFAYNDNTTKITSGRIMGGGTAINGMLWVRGDRHDYDNWAQLGNPGWDYRSVLPYFKKIEDYHGHSTRYEDQFRGHDGPISIVKGYRISSFLKTITQATLELGYNVIDESGPSKIGLTPLHINVKNGIRVSTCEAYVRPNIERANIDVLPTALVTKIIFNTRREAVGVEFEHSNTKKVVKANKEVVLCAGALFSPKLLMLSGIGPEDQLRQHGIPIVHRLPGVGENYQDHPLLFMTYKVRDGTSLTTKTLFDIKELLTYLKTQTGTFTKHPAVNSLGWFNVNGNRKERDWADIQMTFSNVGPGTDGGKTWSRLFGANPQRAEDIFGAYNGMETITISIELSRGLSRGSLKLKSKDPNDPPLVNMNFFENSKDIETAVKGFRLVQQYVATKAVQRDMQAHALPVVYTPCSPHGNDTDAYWECFIRHSVDSGRHYVGTCRMGPSSDRMAVVDHRLRVHGVSRLRVVDASIMPQIVTANTMLTTIMIGEKGADMIKQEFSLV